MENSSHLGKNIATSAKKKVEAQSENYQLNNSNTEQNLNSKRAEEIAYNAIEHHETYHKTQYSYNEKSNEYTEAAFNDYNNGNAGNAQPPPSGDAMPSPSTEQLSTSKEADKEFASRIPDRNASAPSSSSSEDRGILSGTAEKYNGINHGTAEAGSLATNSFRLYANEKKIERLNSKRRYMRRGYRESQTNDGLQFHDYKVRLSKNTRVTGVGRVAQKGLIVKTVREENHKDYDKRLREQEKKAFKRRVTGRLLFSKARSLVNEESIAEDENIAMLKRNSLRATRALAMIARQNIKSIRLQNNVYARLEMAEQKHQVLLNKRERLLSRDNRKSQMDEIRQAQTAKQKHELKKKMAKQRAEKEGSFFRRTRNQFMVKKAGREYRRKAVKRVLSTVFSVGIIFLLIVILLAILLLTFLSVTQGSATYYGAAITQNDYDTITEATAYFRKLETDLDEYLNADRDALEAELEAEYGPDIYEYIYNLADFGFSANTLIAYLSAVYVEFTLEEIREELQEIFDEMYTLTIEVKIEDRDIEKYNPDTGEYYTVTEPKKICYVTLEKKELEEVVEARLPENLKSQYDGYKLSTGGQQVYAPVMREDWTNLISSNYGERIHPITGVRTFHKGVDIAVPEGTKLYSAIKGIVTISEYSESAGNYVTVETNSGWSVTFMHMNSRAVLTGQVLEQGDFVGLSGNTGNSTGAHLHLQVTNEKGETVNPIFIIPQTCAFITQQEQQEVQ